MTRFGKKSSAYQFNDNLKTIGDISLILYFLTDHILLINKMNAFKLNPKFISAVDYLSNLFWGMECGMNLIYDVVDYFKNAEDLKNNKGDLTKIKNNESNGIQK